MQYQHSDKQLSELIIAAAKIGAEQALAASGKITKYLTKKKAFDIYGRANVERWLKERLITPIKDGTDSAKWRMDRAELDAVAAVSNRHTYLTVEERKSK